MARFGVRACPAEIECRFAVTGQNGVVAERDAGDNLTIRTARFDDLDALARLHVLVWRETYRALAPASAYEALDELKRRDHWEDLLSRSPARSLTLVAELDGCLIGFGHAGPGGHEVMAGAGEIVHLYVDASSQGRGFGRTLLHGLISFLNASGYTTIRVAVVRDNDRAVQFYERAGGQVVGHFVDGVLWRSHNVVVEFASFSRSA